MDEVRNHGGGAIARYDTIGSRVLRRFLANGVHLDLRSGSGTYYNSAGLPTYWPHLDTNQLGSPPSTHFESTYDAMGNKYYHTPQHNFPDSQSYIYDSSYRLTFYEREAANADNESTEQWVLDGLGNWSSTSKVINSVTTNESRLDTSFNEYYSVGGVTQAQDDNGNLTNDGTQALPMGIYC